MPLPSYINWDTRGVAPLILNVDTRQEWVGSFKPRPLYPRGMSPRNELNKVLDGLVQSFWMLLRMYKFLIPIGNRTAFPRVSNVLHAQYNLYFIWFICLISTLHQPRVFHRLHYNYRGNLRINRQNNWLNFIAKSILETLISHNFPIIVKKVLYAEKFRQTIGSRLPSTCNLNQLHYVQNLTLNFFIIHLNFSSFYVCVLQVLSFPEIFRLKLCMRSPSCACYFPLHFITSFFNGIFSSS